MADPAADTAQHGAHQSPQQLAAELLEVLFGLLDQLPALPRYARQHPTHAFSLEFAFTGRRGNNFVNEERSQLWTTILCR